MNIKEKMLPVFNWRKKTPKQSVDPEVTLNLELAGKSFKVAIINMFKDLKERWI